MLAFGKDPEGHSTIHLTIHGDREDYVLLVRTLFTLMATMSEEAQLQPQERYIFSSFLQDIMPQPQQLCPQSSSS